MTNYEDTNDVVHHLRFQAELAALDDDDAALHAFEEHFKASAEDPYFENELKLWLTAWRKALDYFTRQAAPVRRTLTMTNDTDPVRELVDQWREVAEYFTGSTGLDIRETLIDCADDLEAALAQQRAVHLASTHCDNCGCDWLDNGLNPIGCPYCKQSDDAKILAAERDALEAENERLRAEVERLKSMTAVTMGVGPGDGNLFVHGDYESIKAAQAIVLERDALRAEVAEWKRVAAAQAELHGEAEDRAYKLAEALRELVDVFSESGMYDEEVFDKARDALEQEPTT